MTNGPEMNGSSSRTRTYDRSVNSRLLYQLSYRGIRPELPGITSDFLSSQAVSSQVLSAFVGLTTVFGMGTGGSLQLSPLDKWSGKRDSNSRPSPWQGDALPLSYFRRNGASGQNRTADTRIFSPLLYRLSYRGKMATLNGFEPSISAVTGRHVRPLHHRAAIIPAKLQYLTGI